MNLVIDITKRPHERAEDLISIQRNGMDFMEFSERNEEMSEFSLDEALAEI